MRLFWSVVLTGGLLFIGLDVYESQKDSATGSADVEMAGARADDGTGMPDPPPPPPPK